jgi:hypothetical protein
MSVAEKKLSAAMKMANGLMPDHTMMLPEPCCYGHTCMRSSHCSLLVSWGICPGGSARLSSEKSKVSTPNVLFLNIKSRRDHLGGIFIFAKLTKNNTYYKVSYCSFIYNYLFTIRHKPNQMEEILPCYLDYAKVKSCKSTICK